MLRRQLQASRRSGQDRGALAIGNPMLYAQQYGLILWLRADAGITLGGTLKATGTSPPAWAITGTATRQVGLHLEIDSVAGGTALGQATYKWSENNGSTYVATGVVTAAGPTALGTTGLSVSMAVGPYNIDNKYDATVSAWADQSGLGNHATKAIAGQQPVFHLANGVCFDGSNDNLTFSTSLTAPTGASFFASTTYTGPDNSVLFVQNERNYYANVIGIDFWNLKINSFINNNIALTPTRQIVEAVDFAPNNVNIGVNGVIANKVTGASYLSQGYAAIGGDINIGQMSASNMKEAMFFSSAVPPAVATAIRRGMALRTGVAVP